MLVCVGPDIANNNWTTEVSLNIYILIKGFLEGSKQMIKFRTAACATVAALALSMTLSAAAVSVDSVSASWTSAAAPPGDFPCIAGLGTTDLSWGHDAAPCDLPPAQQSGFDIDPSIPPAQNFVVPPDTPWFKLADFTHRNNPVNDPITSAVLQLSVAMTIDGNPVNPVFNYTFLLNETPNNPAACGPEGGTPTGAGGVGCNDIVTIVPPPAPAVFVVGGVTVTLDLRFSEDGGLTTTNQFITTENQDNAAALFGRITAVEDQVPEPATFVMAGGALVAAALARRYRASRN